MVVAKGGKTGKSKDGGSLGMRGSRQPTPSSGIPQGYGKCPSHEQWEGLP